MTAVKEGNLAEKSLGELIREVQDESGSGALRLSRERAKTVIYFEDGDIVFAVSNIRAHRLIEFLKRSGLASEETVQNISPNATDDDVVAQFIKLGCFSAEEAAQLRANQMADVLRATLLWIEGDWQFDERVRVPSESHITVDAERLLIESARHLPGEYIASHFANRDDRIETAEQNGHSVNLSPSEGFVHSRVSAAISIHDLLALSGMREEETLRALYALITVGLLRRAGASRAHVSGPRRRSQPVEETVEAFLARIDRAADYYEMLNVGRAATADDIKNSYHALARSYHPDRFHQSSAALQTQIESAFARIARAYEVLHDESARAAYNERLHTPGAKPSKHISAPPVSKMNTKETGNEDRAEASYQKGLSALKENQLQHAVRLFAEAASLEPRRARYRAEYGRALINDPQARRLAEIELRAAISLEPTNVSYRVALAELYKALGLLRRAEGELQRALMRDPKSGAARKLLENLKN